MIVSKRDNPKCEEHTGNVKINQVQIWVNVVTEDGKFDTEVRRHSRNGER